MKTKVKITAKNYYIYKITNILNDRYYIGMHSANNLENNYLGSGSIVKNAVKKHGKENFKKEILYILNSKEELINKEKELITKEIIQDPLCMNIKLGGGSDHVVTIAWSEDRKLEQSLRVSGTNNPIYGKKRTENEREKISKNHADVTGENNPMYNKSHSDISKNKISEIRKIKIANGEILCKVSQMMVKKECPHCKKQCSLGNLSRWHLDNCKRKIINSDVS